MSVECSFEALYSSIRSSMIAASTRVAVSLGTKRFRGPGHRFYICFRIFSLLMQISMVMQFRIRIDV